VTLLCFAHKKAQACTQSFRTLLGFDSQIIRLQLALQGQVKVELRTQCVNLICERLVVIKSGGPSSEAVAYRKSVLETFVQGDSPAAVRRRHVLENLWNGNVRRTDAIEHDDHGIGDFSAILRSFCNEGLDSLLPGVGGACCRGKTGPAPRAPSTSWPYQPFTAAFCPPRSCELPPLLQAPGFGKSPTTTCRRLWVSPCARRQLGRRAGHREP
jgi:hypothetical protein